MINRRTVSLTVFLVALLFAISAPILAQSEVTLEDLSSQLESLTSRVNRLEAIFTGPGSESLPNGCLLGSSGGVQDNTILAYKEKFDEWVTDEDLRVTEVIRDDSGQIRIKYMNVYNFGREGKHVYELWNGCEFVGIDGWYDK